MAVLHEERDCSREELGEEVIATSRLGEEVMVEVGPRGVSVALKVGERDGEGDALGDLLPLRVILGETEVLLLLHGVGVREG